MTYIGSLVGGATKSPEQETDDAPRKQALPAPGDVIGGKYRVERAVREGGMGAVFAAQHEVLGQRVAVKVLLADAAKDEASVARFLFEAHAAANLNSEHVASVIDAGTLANGLPFFVMEYLEGADLGELLRLGGPLAVSELADYMLQALAGLAHAHAAEIIHRDLKPSNVFLAVRPDGTNVIKILDFGISKSTNADASKGYKSLTGQQLLGSPAYMSPEQIRNARGIDSRADIWSVGVVMYELLTGEIPFDGDGVGEILAAILDANPVPVSVRNPAVPKSFSDIVGRCLKKNRDDRFRNAAELAEAIAPFGTGAHDALVDRTAQTLARPPMSVPTPLHAIRITAAGAAYAGPEATTLGPDADGPSSVRLALARTERGGANSLPTNESQRAAHEKTQPSRRRRRGGVLGAIAVIALAVAAFLGRERVLAPFTSHQGERSDQAPAVSAVALPSSAMASTPSDTAVAMPSASSSASATAPSPSSAPSSHAPPRGSNRPGATSAPQSSKPLPSAGRPAILRSRD